MFVSLLFDLILLQGESVAGTCFGVADGDIETNGFAVWQPWDYTEWCKWVVITVLYIWRHSIEECNDGSVCLLLIYCYVSVFMISDDDQHFQGLLLMIKLTKNNPAIQVPLTEYKPTYS